MNQNVNFDSTWISLGISGVCFRYDLYWFCSEQEALNKNTFDSPSMSNTWLRNSVKWYQLRTCISVVLFIASSSQSLIATLSLQNTQLKNSRFSKAKRHRHDCETQSPNHSTITSTRGLLQAFRFVYINEAFVHLIRNQALQPEYKLFQKDRISLLTSLIEKW